MKKRNERKTHETRQTKVRVPKRRMPRVPPPESDVWPEEYRGKNWKPAYAFLFEGKCQLCAHSCPLPKSRQLLDKCQGMTRLLHCTNHPRNPGGIDEVLPTDTCRNFRLKLWRHPRAMRAESLCHSAASSPKRAVKRIKLRDGIFVLLDAADYEKISQYKWYAQRHGRQIYAVSFQRGGKMVYMHRMIAKPRKGYVVDHIDHNGLNNCRCNLRVCTQRQHQANRGPCGGTSRFVGVHREGDKWRATIRWRGKYYNLGLFTDEVEAAKARDRKAHEIHGKFAYLNFPEDFQRRKRVRRARSS
ncbi:MAG: HNH endonuclease [Solirubrobacterales bacterium]